MLRWLERVALCVLAIMPCDCASTRSLDGQIVAYDMRYSLMPRTHPLHAVYFLELTGKPAARRYVKLVYEYWHYENDFPDAALSGRWKFAVRRDRACDEAIRDMPEIERVDIEAGRLLRSWTPSDYIRYVKPEAEAIPTSERLPCYRLVAQRWKRAKE